jgi:hypothetical protein
MNDMALSGTHPTYTEQLSCLIPTIQTKGLSRCERELELELETLVSPKISPYVKMTFSAACNGAKYNPTN